MIERDQFERSDLDARAVDTARVLAMDAVERAGNGHPGTAMSLAPAAYLIFQRLLRHDPTDPDWLGRDRFVLSCGHSSLTLYIQLFLSGYDLTLDDLKRYRAWGSNTPGHPEYGHTVGVETTTGPLGQGISTAVGMAMAARRARGMFDPETPVGESVFDHTIWVIVSDGDIEEGVASEASSLAGHQRLGNLVVLYDDNRISIDGDTAVAMSEDVLKRYEAYGWHTQRVDDAEDVQALNAALEIARDHHDRPSIIAMRSIIAWPAPNAQNTAKAHGAALGPDEVAATKKKLGFDPNRTFEVPDDVLRHARKVIDRGRRLRAEWNKRYEAWRAAHPERAAELDRIRARRLPNGWAKNLPEFPPGKDMATRKASGAVLNAIAPVLPELWGGSADLAESNNTLIEGEPSFVPVESGAKNADPYGRNIHFGVREHAMGAALNGIALHGLFRPYGGTFLVFSDYMRPSVRLAAMMKQPVVYVWTHDSIGLGEDGPTHQPVEHLWALRAIPGLDVVRPADANETVVAWRTILEHHDRPAGLCLSRQNLPTLERSPRTGLASAEGVARGGYILAEASGGTPDVILIATGSEVAIALEARERLEADGVGTRVVSMPCLEWFDAQEPAYRQQVLPPSVRSRVVVEAGISQGWWRLLGDCGECVSLEHFGASAPYATLYEQFGITVERVVAAAHRTLRACSDG
ncbi:transketolase [Carbonactinospora thermoautotrophica]|uniref:Transketolase n=1 Tax=Carbonactinospora thermoautotrophica TaxID=1469144 RepID=A0A132NJ66_9ACTN|nr:transketolase [Carbonactinospora thermoautotrophica]KWX00613.1 transketolase [Carbonactinospora thermoautotrophica]KWX09762.1 transketolase [Carbonactinospora thermoautotrophica]